MNDGAGYAIAAVLARGMGLPLWVAIVLAFVAAVELGRSWR